MYMIFCFRHRSPEADVQKRIRELIENGATNDEIQEFVMEVKAKEVVCFECDSVSDI